MQTRFAFLGLVLGTIPLFYKEVKKEGFSKKYYILIVVALLIGLALFAFNKNAFPPIENPNIFQSVLLGVAVAGSSIIPGVDSAVILSSLGLYELYVSSIANLEFSILIPAGFGLAIGVSIIPNVLNESCILLFNMKSLISLIICVVSFIFSYYLGDIEGNNNKIKSIFKHFKNVPSINSEITEVENSK